MNSQILTSSHQQVQADRRAVAFGGFLLTGVLKKNPSFFPLPPPAAPEADLKNKDWVFVNYTYKRFEGLTARGAIPSYMKSSKR